MIVFDCICGTEIEALDGQAGRKLMCPVCRSDLTVPPRTTASRPEVIPDLGIDFAPPVRLYRRPRRGPARGPSAIGRLAAGVFDLVGTICAVLCGLFILLLLWNALVMATSRERVVIVPVPYIEPTR